MDNVTINVQTGKYKIVTSNSILFNRIDGVDITIGNIKIFFRIKPHSHKLSECSRSVDTKSCSITWNISGNIEISPNTLRTSFPDEVAVFENSTYYMSWFLSRVSAESDFLLLTYSITVQENSELSKITIKDKETGDEESEFQIKLDKHYNKLKSFVEKINSHISTKWNSSVYVDEFDDLKHQIIMNDSSRDVGDLGINIMLIVPMNIVTSISDSHEFNSWHNDNGTELNPPTELWMNFDIKPEYAFDDIIRLIDEDLAWIWFVKDEN